MSSVFVTNKLSDTVFGIVEDDPFRENPIMYLVFGNDHAALIDTGCATDDLLHYLRNDFLQNCDDRQANLIKTQLIVINTHNHYDHVASNWKFSDPKRGLTNGVLDLCASSADRRYTEDWFSTLSWYSGCNVKPYKITRWLGDGEKIHLSKRDENSSLEVIHAPGHTPDSVCLYYPKDRRLFVGDVIYRWAFVMAVGVKACPLAFERSTADLWNFIQRKEAESATPVTLSCGHNDDSLESVYMKRLADLFHRINSGTQRPTSSCCSYFSEYSESDGSLSVTIRRLRWMDGCLKPMMKLCCRR